MPKEVLKILKYLKPRFLVKGERDKERGQLVLSFPVIHKFYAGGANYHIFLTTVIVLTVTKSWRLRLCESRIRKVSCCVFRFKLRSGHNTESRSGILMYWNILQLFVKSHCIAQERVYSRTRLNMLQHAQTRARPLLFTLNTYTNQPTTVSKATRH